MMSPATTPATGEARRNTGSHGYGLVLFASILLVLTGCANLIQGIAAAAAPRCSMRTRTTCSPT